MYLNQRETDTANLALQSLTLTWDVFKLNLPKVQSIRIAFNFNMRCI